MQDNAWPLISVIVPVYKVEKFLSPCVDSILAQTYAHLEVILVDDGSPDDCPRICDAYAEKDGRVRVIHQENGGLSAARNAGLDAVTGDLIGFVDSDDSLSPQMYESLLTAMLDADADISLCNYLFVDEAGNRSRDDLGLQDEVVSGKERILKKLDDAGNWHWVIACNKLYRRELFDGLRYPVGKLHEDEFIIHEILLRCQRAAAISDAHYYYHQHAGSITGSAFTIRRLDGAEAQFARAAALISHGMPAASAYYACSAGLMIMQKGFEWLDRRDPAYKARYHVLTNQFREVAGKLIRSALPLTLKARLTLNYISPYGAWLCVERFLRKAKEAGDGEVRARR